MWLQQDLGSETEIIKVSWFSFQLNPNERILGTELLDDI